MSSLFKIAMFITSFLPLWVSIIFIECVSIFTSTDGSIWTEKSVLIVIFLVNVISIFILYIVYIKFQDEDEKKVTIKYINRENGMNSEYLIAYILPLTSFDFTKWIDVFIFLLYFCILGYLCVKNNNIYNNLLFDIFKYNFYKCHIETEEDEVIIISKSKNLRTGDEISISVLDYPFYIDKNKKL